MRINRDHLPWMLIVGLASCIAAVFYLATWHPDLLPMDVVLPECLKVDPASRVSAGGSPLGLILGSVAFLIFVFAALLGFRKKVRIWKIGSAQMWLRAHIWLTILTIPLVAFHCDFHGGSSMTTWLLVLYSLVMLSGFFGLAMQHLVPRRMKETLPTEFIYEQIPHLRGVLLEKAKKLRESFRSTAPVSAPERTDGNQQAALSYFSDFLDSQVLPYLQAGRGDRLKLGRMDAAQNQFRLLELRLPEEMRAMAVECELWCDERRRMDQQTHLYHWLHGWLIFHIPASLLLIVWTAWHAIVAVFFY